MTEHFGKLSRVKPPRSRQSVGEVPEKAVFIWGQGLTLHLARERPDMVQAEGILAEWRHAKCVPDAVV